MTQEKHYGTIIHWFSDMQRGSIMSDNSQQRVFADGLSLTQNYHQPKTGDRVSFLINHTDGQATAYQVEPIQSAHTQSAPTQTAIITLMEWDFMQNGGFGIQTGKPNQPIFILGQFLTDQSRIPEVGDLFEGRLFQDENGQLMMSDVTLLQPAQPEEPLQTATATAEPTPAHTPTTNTSRPNEPERFTDSLYQLYKAPEPQSIPTLPSNQLLSGTITCWDDTKGYGFIQFGSKAQKIFFHINAFYYSTKRPKPGQNVSFYCKQPVGDERQKAAKVVLRGDEAYLFDDFPSDYNRPRLSKANMLPFITNSLIAAAFAAFLIMHSKILFGVYFVLSVISYFLYKFDKQVAQTRKKKANEYQGRIPEKNLHLFDLLGGWPGALVSRAVYRHKTSKASFIRIFWLTVAVNLAITYALLIHYADNPLLSILRN